VPSRAVRFVVIGGFNSVFSYALFATLTLTVGAKVHYLIILVVTHVVAILEAYVMQRWLVWRVRGRWWHELVRFSGVYAVAFVVNAALLPLLREVFGVPVLVAQAVIMTATAIGTFLIHRGFTFRRAH
jgi:putative flippase GtrA